MEFHPAIGRFHMCVGSSSLLRQPVQLENQQARVAHHCPVLYIFIIISRPRWV
jgi:hypothetical protein